jgi:predicted small secreted protein
MHGERRSARAVSALVLVLVSALTAACQQATGYAGAGSGVQSTAPPTSTGYGPVFLGPGECASRGREFREVPCTSEKAAARVIARYQGRPVSGTACPAATDFVLHISETRAAADENGDGEVAQGYACMRNLEPPHPGDPGGGGGPHTVVGDCVYDAGKGQVKETACDGSGERDPQFEVASAVRGKAQCPSTTALYVQLGGEKPVGCARRV